MAERFSRWGQNDTARALLLRQYYLEVDIHVAESNAEDLRIHLEELLPEKKNTRSKLEFLERLEKQQRENISNARKELECMDAKALGDSELKNFVKGCSQGIICETVEDVKAVHTLLCLTGDLRKGVGLDPNCPNFGQLQAAAEERRLKVILAETASARAESSNISASVDTA